MVLAATIALAQQPAQYTIYKYNPFTINPAYAGKGESLIANAALRQQWSGLQGAPQSQNINAHMPLNIISSGIGINLESDKLGTQQATYIALSYAYHLRLQKHQTLSVGVRGGLQQLNWNGSAIRTPDGQYPVNIVEHKDGILGNSSFGGSAPSIDAGLWFRTKNIQIGAAVKNLTQNSINYAINNGNIRLVTNYFFTFAADLQFDDNLTLSPSLLFKSDLIENQLDININSELYNRFFFGIGYRGYSKNSTDALTFLAGAKLNEKINLFYGYDFSLSRLKNSSSGSHEILLQYNLNTLIGKGTPEKIIYNPRYF